MTLNKEKKQLSIGSNGYFFIDGFHVDEDVYMAEEVKQNSIKAEIQNSVKDRKIEILEAKIDMLISAFYRGVQSKNEREMLELKLKAIK